MHRLSFVDAVSNKSRRLITHADATLGPDTLAARVLRHPTMMLGGPRALLLQITEPGVAAGVVMHSNYGIDPYQRLASTLETIRAIAFGSPQQAQLMRSRMDRAHSAVVGVSTAGTAYDASDERLATWVYAALVDTIMTVEKRYINRLSTTERNMLFGELVLLGQALGLPAGALAEDLGDFQMWMSERVEALCGGGLTDEALAVGDGVLRPQTSALRLVMRAGHTPRALGLSTKVIAQVTADLGPDALCAAYGLPDRAEESRLARHGLSVAVSLMAASRYALYFPVGSTTPMFWLSQRLAPG